MSDFDDDDGFVSLDDALPVMRELAVAIRVGDLADAAYQLDKLAAQMGSKAQHEVSLGRFMSVPHRAPQAA